MEELKKFCENSSMKGVPRVMKAKKLPLRLLWILSVVCLFIVCFLMSGNLVATYWEKPRVIKLTDLNALSSDYDTHQDLFSLPDITVCNQNPLTAYSKYNGTSWLEYAQKLNASIVNQAELGMYLTSFNYLAYLGPKAVVETRGEFDFVVSCEYGYTMNHAVRPCGEKLKLRHFPNTLFSQCYTVTVEDETERIQPTSVSLTLFLDDVHASIKSYDSRSSSGAAVVLHEAGTAPELETADFAAAGQLTTFNVRQNVYERLNDDLMPCRDVAEVGEIYDLAGWEYQYSQIGCLQAHSQRMWLDACGCINPSMAFSPGRNTTIHNMRFCGAFTENQTQMHEEQACQIGSSNTIIDEVMSLCHPPCRQLSQTVRVSTSPWPADSAQLGFYAAVVHHSPFAGYFSVYARIQQELRASGNEEKVFKDLAGLSLIEKNFAKVEIKLPALQATLAKDTYQMTLSDLFASIGGNLNLWCGISTILLVEVVDLFLRLLLLCSKHPTRTTTVTALNDSKR